MPAKMKLRSAYPNLPTAERKVADFILGNPARASLMVINEIADAAGVSVPSVTRLARKLGYDGFLDFRVALASDSSSLESLKSEPIRPEDGAETVIEKSFVACMRAIEDTLKSVNKQKLSGLADYAIKARRIFIFGSAASKQLMNEFASQLSVKGYDATVVYDAAVMAALSTRFTHEDVFIGISRSGKTKQLLDALRASKARGCYTAFVSNYINSPAAGIADSFFCTSCVDDMKNMTGRESSITMTALLSTLVALMTHKRRVSENA